MVRLLEGTLRPSMSSSWGSLNTIIVLGTPLLISVLDLIALVAQIVEWRGPSLQVWTDIGCIHAAAAGLWMFSVWLALDEWAEGSFRPSLNFWRRVIFYLISMGIYLMGIALLIGGFGVLIFIHVFM